ncbi:MAG: methyl-accepting chemotaxis protein [Aminipila sp.]
MKSLRSKMIIIISAIILVMSLANIVACIYGGYYAICKNVEKDMKAMGSIADMTLSTEIQLIKQQAASLAEQCPTVAPGNEITALSYLDGLLSNYPFMSTALIDKSGKVTSLNKNIDGKDFSNLNIFKKAQSGETVISTIDSIDKETAYFYIASPLQASSQYDGVFVAVLDGLHFSNLISNIVIGETGNIFMLDQNGAFVANKRSNLVIEKQNFIEKGKTDPSYENTAKLYTRMINGEKGVDRYAYETGARICAFGTVEGSDGWSYGVVAPIKEMVASIIYMVLMTIASSSVFFIIAVVCTVILANKITQPIIAITNRMKLLSEGDLSTEVIIHNSNDEIGDLTKDISVTVNTLKTYIQDISDVLLGISKGDLTCQPSAEFKGEFVNIKHSLENILTALNQVFGEINESAHQVASGSEQLASGAQLLSQGAINQSSSLEQLAASINEITEHINATSQNAETATQKSLETSDLVSLGQEEMRNLVNAIEEINETSGQIGKIIQTVEDIAFQTNILALNAAVEAARVGSAGKGFAVVADEVRNLASKSADAAKDTAVLIEKSIASVSNGTAIAQKAAGSLEEIVESTKIASSLVEQISNDTVRQADAITQINMGVEQISAVVQTNSATAQETAASSEELSGQSDMLLQSINNFKLNY